MYILKWLNAPDTGIHLHLSFAVKEPGRIADSNSGSSVHPRKPNKTYIEKYLPLTFTKILTSCPTAFRLRGAPIPAELHAIEGWLLTARFFQQPSFFDGFCEAIKTSHIPTHSLRCRDIASWDWADCLISWRIEASH